MSDQCASAQGSVATPLVHDADEHTLHVAMNLRRIHPIRSGIEAYIAGVVNGLAQVGGVTIHATGVPVDGHLPSKVDTSAVCDPSPSSRLRKAYFDLVHTGTVARRTPAAVYHGLDGFLPVGLPAAIRTVVTVYDLGFLRHPELFDAQTRWLNTWHARVRLHHSAALLAISETTASDLMSLLSIPASRIQVVGSGYDDFFHADPAPAAGGERFFLAVGGDNPRKNLRRVLAAFARWRNRAPKHRDVTLRVVGVVSETFRQSLGADAEGVTFEGFVSRNRLRTLYRETSGLVFPALYEGFGIPIVEAMACGAPVLTSRDGATAEVAGGSAVLIDPYDINAIADGLTLLVERERDLRVGGHTRASMFSWPSTATAIRSAYAAVIS